MDEDRLTELYRQYAAVIYGRCRKMLDDDAEAEDATHETFLRVHRHLARLPPSREALYWIYRVATNLCLNEIRDRRRRALSVEVLPERSYLQHDEEQVLADRNTVRRLIERAPSKVRPAAWLCHIDGFEQGEVAQILDVSQRTVANRLSEFQASVRRLLKKEELS